MTIFNPDEQNRNLDSRIVAGMERLSQVFRALLWEQAVQQSLSPIQIQLLIFIRYHSAAENNVSYLAGAFDLTKPTISDAVKVLAQKGLIRKIPDLSDSRRYSIELTAGGMQVVSDTESFTAPFTEWIVQVGEGEKQLLWKAIAGLIRTLNRTGVISVQRTCYSCRYHTVEEDIHFCNLLKEQLPVENIRIDCPEYAAGQGMTV